MGLVGVAIAALTLLSPELLTEEAHLADLADAIASASSSQADVADLVAVGYWETGRSWDCSLVGDHGHSVSCWQLWRCPGRLCERLKADMPFAAATALEAMRDSKRVCRKVKGATRLSLYATGHCKPNPDARLRERTAQWLVDHVDASLPDTSEFEE